MTDAVKVLGSRSGVGSRSPMCNGFNHYPDCNCGFGGDTAWARDYGGTVEVPSILAVGRTATDVVVRDTSDLCRPTTCPICGGAVYFVRHNDGVVWFDELGWPWPKHACFDSAPDPDPSSSRPGRLADHIRDIAEEDREARFGVITRGSTRATRWDRSYTITTFDNDASEVHVDPKWLPQNLVGKYVAFSTRSPRLVVLGTPTTYRVYYPASSLVLEPGVQCRHPQYGQGVVISVAHEGGDRIIVIEFTTKMRFHWARWYYLPGYVQVDGEGLSYEASSLGKPECVFVREHGTLVQRTELEGGTGFVAEYRMRKHLQVQDAWLCIDHSVA